MTLSDMVGVSPALVSSDDGFTPSIRPIKYRYVMADLRTGKVISTLPLTAVTYAVGIYSGQEMSGTVYLPDMHLDLMAHPPYNDYQRVKHPDRGTPIGSMFECGNRAIYVMRNEEVVWGGILWSRAYSSGDSTMAITALSWEGYIYYRALRKSVVFLAKTDRYTIWRALLAQVLALTLSPTYPPAASNGRSDFDWLGEDGKGKNNGAVLAEGGGAPWTGITRASKSNQIPIDFDERWPYNSPPIELPPAGLISETVGTPGLAKGTVNESWRGYDMNNVGEALQQWAQNDTLVSTVANFEYRVLCWWDESMQRFRQRYTFGEMIYSTPGDYRTTPTGISSLLVGKNLYKTAITSDNPLIFDFPGQISNWSLTESMEDAATRIIVTGNSGSDGASKIAAYEAADVLLRPVTANKGIDGWVLYDKVFGYDSSSPTQITNRAAALLKMHWPPLAATIEDAEVGLASGAQRTSSRATQLSVTLYVDPTTTVPEWHIGDWAAFAIEDPFYGGKMYFVRRIVSYSVTVVPDHESDYSHEQITLELTDDSKQDPGS